MARCWNAARRRWTRRSPRSESSPVLRQPEPLPKRKRGPGFTGPRGRVADAEQVRLGATLGEQLGTGAQVHADAGVDPEVAAERRPLGRFAARFEALLMDGSAELEADLERDY